MGNPYAAKTRNRPLPGTVAPTIPSGTVAELIKWVGDDKDRAKLVLDQENEQEKPRKSLTGPMKEVIDG